MVGFLALPAGAVSMLILQLFGVSKKFLWGMFFGVLGAAFIANGFEWMRGMPEQFISTLYSVDNFTRFFISIFIFSTALGALTLFRKHSDDVPLFSVLLLFAVFAMALVSASTGVISLFLSLEFLAISLYELVGLTKKRDGMEAAMKFFIVGVFSSLLFLLGAALYYGVLGSTDFSALSAAKLTPLLIASLVLMFIGIGFKMSVFPLNLWVPDVYQGAPGSITAILASAAKKAGFAAYMRLALPLMTIPIFSADPYRAVRQLFAWQSFIAIIAATTMLFGAIAAAMQQNVKRLIAYSIISHAGFIAIGLAAGTRFGYQAALLHIAVHAFMAAGVFIMISHLEDRGVHTLDDYNGLAKQNPQFAYAFAIFLASLTGVPPLAGFIGKFLLFTSAIHAGFIWLAIIAAVSSVISAYFYFIIMRRMFGYNPGEGKIDLTMPLLQKLSWGIPAILIVSLGFFPQGLLRIIHDIF